MRLSFEGDVYRSEMEFEIEKTMLSEKWETVHCLYVLKMY